MRQNDSLLIAILITVSCLGGVTVTTEMNLWDAIRVWGGGLSALNGFITQIALILVAAIIVAHTDFAAGIISRASALPRTARQAYCMATLVSGFASLISGALGLIVGGILVLNIARQLQHKNIEVDYPLLVASAYAGFVVWHMGLNGVAPLFMATADNEMLHITGHLIPVTETIFAPWNILLACLVLVSVSVSSVLMHPASGQQKVFVDSEQTGAGGMPGGDSDKALVKVRQHPRPGSWQWVPTFILGSLMAVYLIIDVVLGSRSIDFNVIIWTLVAFGLIFSGGTQNYSYLAVKGASSVAPILIQYPLYAGVMVLLTESGAISSMSSWVAGFATAETLGIYAFLSAGVVNFLIPSGGAQWVMQGPIFLEAGKSLGVEYPIVIMAIAYGDQWSNMIQPFWALPLLAIAGLSVRDIFRYLLVIFIVSGLILGAGIYLASAMYG